MTDPKRLTIYIDETDVLDDVPLYEVIVRRLLILEAAGATVHTGIMGFGKHGRVHRKRLFGISDDRPVMITVIDSGERIATLIREIRPMVREGLMIVESVEVVTAG